MHILVTVIGKNIPSNDTIINNQTFYPFLFPAPSFLFIIKSIECHYLRTRQWIINLGVRFMSAEIRTFPELLNWNILHLCHFSPDLDSYICWTNGIGTWYTMYLLLLRSCQPWPGSQGSDIFVRLFPDFLLVTNMGEYSSRKTLSYQATKYLILGWLCPKNMEK